MTTSTMYNTEFQSLPQARSLVTTLDQKVSISQQESIATQPNVLPCVIPQVSKSFRGAFFSPFARAYPPALAAHGIQQDEFLAFIDGLNEVFVAHPIFQGLGLAGAVMSMAYGVHPVQWAGMGLQLSSGVASAATSYLKTKAYIKAINMELFNPAGLHVNIMTTKKMMAKIGLEDQKLQLHPTSLPIKDASPLRDAITQSPLSEVQLMPGLDHSRAQTLEALRGYVMPLSFDVPAATPPDNLLRKLNANHATRLTAKQNKKAIKQRNEANEEIAKLNREAEEEFAKGDKDVQEKQRKADKEIAKLQSKVLSAGSASKRSKATEKLEKEKAKLLKEVAKEEKERAKKVEEKRQDARKEVTKVEDEEGKITNKIRWVVISKWKGQETDLSDYDKDLDDGEVANSTPL